jgi:hypothetical protein
LLQDGAVGVKSWKSDGDVVPMVDNLKMEEGISVAYLSVSVFHVGMGIGPMIGPMMDTMGEDHTLINNAVTVSTNMYQQKCFAACHLLSSFSLFLTVILIIVVIVKLGKELLRPKSRI